MSLEKIPFCNVFYPNEQEMKDFSSFVEKCEKQVKTGIFKIIPPKKFVARKDKYIGFDFKIPHPIEQVVSGENGVYKITLFSQSARLFSKYAKSMKDENNSLSPIEIENLFWKSMKYSSPLYGSDSPGSIFDKDVLWNLNEIKNPLKDGLNYQNLSGITSPYLYFGCWRSMFCFHKEDMDLNSINYLHFGKPKHWYGVPENEDEKLTALMIKLFPNDYRRCSEFMRHKNFLVHPKILLDNGIHVYKCIQEPGQFVITKSGSYHAGFNYGVNCAEAVNFCTSSWIKKGFKAKPCVCQKGYVDIDMPIFLDNLKQNSKNKSLLEHISKMEKNVKNKKKEEDHKIKVIENETEDEIPITSIKLEDDKYETWRQCDNKKCDKWRKIKNKFLANKQHFVCSNLKNFTCETKEENWKRKYVTVRKKLKDKIKKKLNEKEVKGKRRVIQGKVLGRNRKK